MLDLAQKNLSQASEQGYEFELLYPGSNERTGAFVTVRGNHSKTVKAYGRRKYTELQQRSQAAKRKGREDDLTPEDAEDLAIESAIVRIISWRGIALKGQELPFTKENAEQVLREHSWIREQVAEESENLLNFQS